MRHLYTHLLVLGTDHILQFFVGDVRGNENRILLGIQILFFREHNRVADLIWKARGSPNPCSRGCNDVCCKISF